MKDFKHGTWYPIEEYDGYLGKPVIISNGEYLGSALKIDDEWVVCVSNNLHSYNHGLNPSIKKSPPTHFMPLPDPPKSETKFGEWQNLDNFPNNCDVLVQFQDDHSQRTTQRYSRSIEEIMDAGIDYWMPLPKPKVDSALQ